MYDIYQESVKNKVLIVVEVFPGNDTSYFIKSFGKENGTFIRLDATTRNADITTIDELELRGKRRYYDELPFTELDVTENDIATLCNEFSKRAKHESYDNPFIGTDFHLVKFSDLFTLDEEKGKISFTKEKMILMDDSNSETLENKSLEAELKNTEWYMIDSFWGTSEERKLIEFIKGHEGDLSKKYDSFQLLRNEEVYKIFDFDTGRGFQPDFLLLLYGKQNGQNAYYQVFIEPKGKHLAGEDNDGWKELCNHSDTVQHNDLQVVPFLNNFADESFNPFSVIYSSHESTYLELILPILPHGIVPFFQYSGTDLDGVPPVAMSNISFNFFFILSILNSQLVNAVRREQIRVTVFRSQVVLIAPCGQTALQSPQRMQSIEFGFLYTGISNLQIFWHAPHFVHFSESILNL